MSTDTLIYRGIALIPEPWRERLIDLLKKREGIIVKIQFSGWATIIASFLIGAVAYNTGNNLVFLILSSTLALIIVSGLLSRFNLRKLPITLDCPRSSAAGKAPFATVAIDQKMYRWPVFGIGMTFEVIRSASTSRGGSRGKSILKDSIFFAQIAPREKAVKPMNLPPLKRGLYEVKLSSIRSAYPFGFFLKESRYHLGKELLIHPQIAQIDALSLPEIKLAGNQHIHAPGDGVDLISIRDYRPGDPLRRIHWKATAKTGRRLVRELARDQNPRVLLYLDHFASETDTDEDYEKALALTAGICSSLLNHNYAVGLQTPFGQIPAKAGMLHLPGILDHLGSLPHDPDRREGLGDKNIAPTRNVLFLIWQKNVRTPLGSPHLHLLDIPLSEPLTIIK